MARVLIMEDDAEQAALLQSILVNAGHEVVVTYDGDEAWVYLSSTQCDVLLTDMSVSSALNAPRSAGGLSLIGKLRTARSPDAPDWFDTIRIVAISGVPGIGSNILRMAKTLGADICLAKPAGVDDILGAIDADTPRKSP